MTDWQPLWKSIYEQVNAHYREIAKKRDQAIAFYLLLVGATVGAWDRLREVRDVVLIAVWLVGLAAFAICVQYWRWHIVHTLSFVTIQRLMRTSGPHTLEDCKAAWEAANDTEFGIWQLIKPWRGVETAILWLLALLTFIPAYLLFRQSALAPWRSDSELLAFVVDLVPYAIVLLFSAGAFVRKYFRFRETEWPFRWLREPGIPSAAQSAIAPGEPDPVVPPAKAHD